MRDKHEKLVAAAKKAIRAVYTDMSVTPAETLASMYALWGEIDTAMDALEEPDDLV